MNNKRIFKRLLVLNLRFPNAASNHIRKFRKVDDNWRTKIA
jgi:hypothetical protein